MNFTDRPSDNWRIVKETLPNFNESVIVYCPFYGRYLAWYECLIEDYGQWNNWKGEKGILPPTHWQPLPEPPK